MSTLKLKREAYHGGAFVGSDIKALMDLFLIELLCAIISAQRVATKLQVEPDGHVTVCLLRLGSSAIADQHKELFSSFSDAMSLFARGTPLCEHHILDFSKRTARYAAAYATALPNEQSQPKTHLLCAEMPGEAERIGGPGMLGEHASEGIHVRDNMLKRRYATTSNVPENLRLRKMQLDRLSDTRIANICDVEERATANKRAQLPHASRKRSNHGAGRK